MKTQALKRLQQLINEEVDEQLNRGRTDEESVAAAVVAKNIGLKVDAGNDLADRQILRMSHEALRLRVRDDEDGEQIRIEGFEAPSAFAVPKDNAPGSYYVPTPLAVWKELSQGLDIRTENARRVVSRTEEFRRLVEHVRPVMEANPSITVDEALSQLNAA